MMLYERLLFLLEEKKVNAAELARATGIPYTTILSIIKQKQDNTSIENASKIAKYFGVTLEWFATGREIKKDEMSDIQKKVMAMVPKLTREEERAVLAFMNSLMEMRGK